MRIVVDAFGGDNAPLEIIKGAAAAKKEYGVELILTGSVNSMLEISGANGIDLSGIELRDAPQIMDMHDDAKAVLRQKADSSMGSALRMLSAGEADAAVSAGPTGAYLMGATMIVKRIRGVKRPALATVIPGYRNPYLLIDCGANVEARPEMLLQFGVMGSIYMKRVMGLGEPRVGLANNGAEDSKGTDLQREAYRMLQGNGALRFLGNIEGRDIPAGDCDVVVTDGFTGNMILKTVEGMAKMVFSMVKDVFTASAKNKVGALLMKSGIMELRRQMDYTEYGGAPLIGLQKPVIKAHGSSNANAIKHAIRQAVAWSEAGVTEAIAEAAGAAGDVQ